MRNVKLAALGLGLSCLASGALAETIQADVWADNWFAFYVNDRLVAEDSVSITTERSFNSESFSFDADPPFALNFIVKDFKENDSGLEYIGTGRQQMGDGGFVAQFLDGSGNLVAATNDDWRCLVVHNAPMQKSCAREVNPIAGAGACAFTEIAEPAGWKMPGFDDSGWDRAVEYSPGAVRPKDGYDRIRWHDEATLIWGPDLETNNTLLCRLTIE